MANSSTNIDQLIQSQASKEVTVNAFFDAASQAVTYGRRASTTSGLTWGYYGGNVVVSSGALTAIANGTLLLTGSATNYAVALKATGAVSVSTSITNFNDTALYWPLYSIVTGVSAVTSYTDVRVSPFNAAVGSGSGSGTFIPAPDGTERILTETQTLHVQATPEDNEWFALCWSEDLGRAVAIARSGTNRVMWSDDGVRWTLATAANAVDWRDVVWANTLRLFVAVAATGTAAQQVMTSPDGVTWTARTSSLATSWGALAWSPELGLLVAVAESGANRVMTSPDGITWTSRVAAEANDWRDVCWGAEAGKFVAVSLTGTNRVMHSENGVNWTSAAAATVNSWSGVVWGAGPGRFAAVAQSGTVMYSPDAVTWTAGTAAFSTTWFKVEWAPELGLFAAVHLASAATYMTSRDGATWTSRVAATTNAKRKIKWARGLGMFIVSAAAGVGNRIETSAGFSGEYIPTLTNVTNVAASTAYRWQWQRRGRTVTVSGKLDIDATAAAATELGVSLPFSSALTADTQVGGSMVHPALGTAAAILGDATNDRASVQFLAPDTNNNSYYGAYTYRII